MFFFVIMYSVRKGEFQLLKEIENLIKSWGNDIRTININNYDDVLEVLVNGHKLIIITKQ